MGYFLNPENVLSFRSIERKLNPEKQPVHQMSCFHGNGFTYNERKNEYL